jgi:hypothetical protein
LYCYTEEFAKLMGEIKPDLGLLATLSIFREVGMYKLNSVYPWLTSAWSQPSMACKRLVSTHEVKKRFQSLLFQIHELVLLPRGDPRELVLLGGGLYKFNAVYP